jgi:uncharacterized membrane protein
MVTRSSDAPATVEEQLTPDEGRPLWNPQRAAWLAKRLTMVVLALVGIESAVMIWLQYRQHVNYGTYGYDVGLYDQATWLLGQGPFSSPFLTSRGLPVWGHHVNPILIALSPLTRLGAGVLFLSGLQTIAVFLGALPVAWLTRSKTGSAEAGLGLAIVYLLYPANIFFAFSYFHPELLAPLPMLLMAWFAHQRRLKPMWVAAVVALSCREEVSVAIAAYALVLLLGALRRRDRVLIVNAALLIGVSAAWFLICNKVIIPGALGGEPFYLGTFYGKYGSSYGEIARNLVSDPSLARGLVTDGNRSSFILDLFGPLLFLPMLGLPVIMVIGPLTGLLMSSSPQSHSIQSHYPAILIAGLFLATIEVVRRQWPRRWGRGLVIALLLSSFGASITRSAAPWSVSSFVWKSKEPRRATLDEAVALIPADARVSAMGNIMPHLSHRRVVYQFPNPMERYFYGEFALEDPAGAHGPTARFPEPVDWIIVQRSGLRSFAYVIERAIQDGTFEVVFDRDDVLVVRRTVEQSTESP